MAQRARKALLAVLATSIVLGVTALICEIGFRTLLFSNAAFMERFREPSLYADYYSDDDWWKLYYAFHKPPNETARRAHPLLGWSSGDFSKKTYLHVETGQVGRRRPVLLYGDSFAHCVTAAKECFQGILNADSAFSRDHDLLNYGVAGYGVDQMYLLLQKSLPLYEQPYVVVGIHTRDLDRDILSFFVGQKPHFDLVSDQLVLRGTPIVENPQTYLSRHPPRIWSYLYRLWLYQEGRPWRLRRYLRGTEGKLTREKRINEALLTEMVREIERRNLPHTFVIFVAQDEVKSVGWREQFLSDVFTRLGVPYLSTRTLIQQDMLRTGTPLVSYFLAGDGHPNAYQNLLVAKELECRVLSSGAAHPTPE